MEAKTAATLVCKALQHAGHTALFAGGCVRDMLMGSEPKDFDIATSATPDEVESLFKRTVPVGKAFGVIVVLEGGHEFEVATFRADGEYSDGRRPDSVEFSSPEEDAKRRDLTINGLFFDPIKEEVFDFVGGRQDLEDGVIRFIGDAEERIEEDRLRMLRVVRFAARFGFDVDPETISTVAHNAHKIHSVSVERIKAELDKMLLGDVPSRAFELLRAFGLLDHVLPKVTKLWDAPQSPKWHSEGNCGTHTMMVLDATRRRTGNLATLWAAVLHDVAKPDTAVVKEDGTISNHGHDRLGAEMADELLRQLKASNDEREAAVAMVRDHMKSGEASKMKKSTLRRFVSQDHFDELMHLFAADCESSIPADPDRADHKMDGVAFLQEAAEKIGEQRKLPTPFVNGRHLIDMGLKPGPQFKELLTEMMDRQLEGQFKDEQEALEFLKTLV